MTNYVRYALVMTGAMLSTPSLAQQYPNNSPSETSVGRAPADGNAAYFAVGGGLVMPDRLRTDAGINAKLDDGYMVLAAVGGRVGPFRGEIEGSYRRASVDNASGFGLTARGTGRVERTSWR